MRLPDFESKGFSKADELRGSLKFQDIESKLMHSVLEHDSKTVKKGKLLSQAINQGFSSFHPELMFEKIVQEYSMAQNLYGESLLRLISGYEPGYIKRNINIPEFQKELKQRMMDCFDELVKDRIISRDGEILNKGYEMASLILYTEELDALMPEGLIGRKISKKASHYGDKEGIKLYKKGDRYRDISMKKTVKTAIRRGHKELAKGDLKVHERQSRGGIYIIYGMDSSGSMKGEKMEMAKKAGIALAYKAIEDKDNVGLLVFGANVTDSIEPGQDFGRLLKAMTKARAAKETNIARMIHEAIAIFPKGEATKHLIILSDALPTTGKEPEKETLQSVSEARAAGVTISLIGISLDEKGRKLAEKIAQLGEGRLYQVKNIEEMDAIVLEDYYAVG